jgi:hypothetical protein
VKLIRYQDARIAFATPRIPGARTVVPFPRRFMWDSTSRIAGPGAAIPFPVRAIAFAARGERMKAPSSAKDLVPSLNGLLEGSDS